jgi:hypothetical protein
MASPETRFTYKSVSAGKQAGVLIGIERGKAVIDKPRCVSPYTA